MIVVDTQMPVHATVRGDDSELAKRVRRRDPEWAAPLLWHSEYRNALLRHVRASIVTPAEAVACDRRAIRLIGGREHVPDSAAVFREALASKLTAYDAEFVVVARALGVKLVTFDKQILANCGDVAVHPADFVRVS